MTAVPADFKTALADRYEIDRELGRGGMGVVFKARQISLNRTVAVKMIITGQPWVSSPWLLPNTEAKLAKV